MRTSLKSKLCNLHTCIGNCSKSKMKIYFDEIADGIFDYNMQDGYHNLGNWVEAVAKKKGK